MKDPMSDFDKAAIAMIILWAVILAAMFTIAMVLVN